ncbi:MAG: beta-lactamase family protein [Anaerolineae bacterium]|nr:beta-lactamase family protein [Anaerolineae bacterium]
MNSSILARMRWALLLMLVTVLITYNSRSILAQTDAPDFAAIDAQVAAQMQANNLPGLALGIVHGDQIVHLQSFGSADPSGRAITPRTPFALASLTKSFTALAIMQLVETGQVELDAPVQRYLPWFTLADTDAAARITVRHLLNHTSGISRLTGNYILPTTDYHVPDPESYIRGLSSADLAHPVGETPEYSNANYAILGLIVEAVSGMSYEGYVTDHILAPLDMAHTTFSVDAAQQNGMATGHQMQFDRPLPVDLIFPYAFVAAGGLISTAEDMSHYLIAYLNQGRYGDETLLSPDGMAQLWTPPDTIPLDAQSNYAMGWVADAPYAESGVDHSGSSGNFHAHMAVSPKSGWGVVILVNADHLLLMTQPVELMTWGVIRALEGQPLPESPSITRVLFVATFVIAALQLLSLIWGVFRLRRWSRDPASRPHGVVQVTLRIILPVLLNLLVAYIFLVGLPAFAGLPFAAVMAYIPDWGYGFVAGGVLALGWLIWGVASFVVLRTSRARQPTTDNPLHAISGQPAR